MHVASTAIVSTAALATGAYLNAKLSIGTDLNQLALDREFRARLVQRIQRLGDTCTLYRSFELANAQDEALWFEGRTWTYGVLKNGEWITQIIAVVECRSPDVIAL